MTIIHILTQIYNMFDTSKNQQIAEEEYLNKAISIDDLERRMREIENKNGRAWL